MEPDVIRMYSSSPPPMEDGVEEEDDEFGDFGTFSAVPNSISFTELETPTTFNQNQALTATSPPELNSRGVVLNHGSSNGTHCPGNELSKANGVVPTSRPPCCPSERTEMKKVISGSPDLSVSETVSSEPLDCNGGGSEVLTNGFANSDTQQSPSQTFVHNHIAETSIKETGSCPEDDFADFAAFSSTDRGLSQAANEDSEGPADDGWGPEATYYEEHYNAEQGMTSEDLVKDTHRTGADTSGPAVHEEGLCNTDRGSDEDFPQSEEVFTLEHSGRRLCLNGVEEPKEESELSSDLAADCEAGQSEEKSSGNETETETETETSFGRPLSTDALEEYGDVSTTGSAPSPLLPGDTATPADHSQLAEDDEDFGDFGDAGSFSAQGFADFEQLEVQQDQNQTETFPPAQDVNAEQDDDFGDFNSPKFHTGENDAEDGGGTFASFPVSDSFGNFNSAGDDEDDSDWNAFGGQQQQEDGESWAAFGTEQTVAPTGDCRQEKVEDEEEEEEEEEWHESEAPPVNIDTSRTDQESASLSGRLERVFQSSFPQIATQPLDDEVVSLRNLLEPPKVRSQGGAEEEEKKEHKGQQTPPCDRYVSVGVWTQLQDIHEALGLRYQWGGSHCNKVLLCCLGIDTRNILFTGQKKQPVIVPMYAASLGMLEPTKEPVKPVSAAEMIASIGQAPPPAPESSPCPSDSTQQEALPPVQFDWSSSGLTNPLDGVDPELYELTTSKLDPGSSGSRVADAFARLMSTMEKTSTSTRKPKKDENLSEEASKVITALPDLSFMQAKVLMFPATLTPLSTQATTD